MMSILKSALEGLDVVLLRCEASRVQQDLSLKAAEAVETACIPPVQLEP